MKEKVSDKERVIKDLRLGIAEKGIKMDPFPMEYDISEGREEDEKISIWERVQDFFNDLISKWKH